MIAPENSGASGPGDMEPRNYSDGVDGAHEQMAAVVSGLSKVRLWNTGRRGREALNNYYVFLLLGSRQAAF